MSEPRVNEGIKGVGRYLQSWATEGELRRQSTCVFAIGRNGPPWFRSVGYRAERIFPFAYFIDPLPSHEHVPLTAAVPIRIGYLGRLVRDKGVFDLLAAFASFGPEEAVLELAGPYGDDEPEVRDAIGKCFGKVVLHGSIPMVEVHAFLARLDVLILPSITKDGWGVVVTEALMAGLPVVSTSFVGASVVLDNPRLGQVVQPHAPLQLALAIRRAASLENLTQEERRWRSNWAQSHLSAEAGASFFWRCLDYCMGNFGPPVPFYE